MSVTKVIEQPQSSISITRSSSRTQSSPKHLDVETPAALTDIHTLGTTSPCHDLVNDLTPTRSYQRSSIQPFDGIVETRPIASAGSMAPAMLRKENTYFLAMCFPLFLAGWNELNSLYFQGFYDYF